VAGQLDKSEQGNKIKALRLHLLADVKKKGTTRIDIRLSATGLTQDDLLKVKDVLLRHRGDVPVYLRLQNPTRKDSLISVGRDIRVTPSDKFIAEVESVLGAGAVPFRNYC
jgi:DNA polymerase-3 subunit alpha